MLLADDKWEDITQLTSTRQLTPFKSKKKDDEMISKSLLISSLTLFTAVTLWSSSARGALVSFDLCHVGSAGTTDAGVVEISLDPDIGNGVINYKTFTAPAGEENRMLAIAITAIAGGKDVSCTVDFANPGDVVDMRLLAR